jgi:integrase
VLLRIEAAIALGTWRELRREMTEGPIPDYTIEQFSKIYYEGYCKIRNTRPDFKKETLAVINRFVGKIPLRQFSKSDAHSFERDRSAEVSAATVNRGLSVLSNLFTFAKRQGLIDRNPMEGYGRIPVDQKAMQVLEPHQVRQIVEATMVVDPVVGAYVGVLGETGLRMMEGMNLRWDYVSFSRRQITIEASKNYKVRHVPISEYAIGLLHTLTRVVGNPHVFVRTSTMSELRAPRKEFEAGKKAAGILWPGFHDFRHFRATQWLKYGVDIRTVQEWLGHRDVSTTMKYLHFVEGHARRSFEAAERLELAELAQPAAVAVGDE